MNVIFRLSSYNGVDFGLCEIFFYGVRILTVTGCVVGSSTGGSASSGVASSPITAISVTASVVIFTIIVFCVVASCCTRHHHTKTAQPLKPSPRHMASGPGTTALTGSCRHATGYLPSLHSPLPITEVHHPRSRPPSLYQTVCSDTVCPSLKSSWASTAVPLSELWSASQIGSRRTSAFPSRQIQPITLHYYNDF